jgi:L-2-hydroxyglutarate oxidase
MATAMALVNKCRVSLVVLEAEERLAAHQSGNNSGVIHSGLYYKPGSLKARTCVAGREAMYAFCRENGISYERCGKVVVATSRSQLPALAELKRRGLINGLKSLKRLRPQDIQAYEPHAAGIAGLWCPETGIVNYVQVTQAFADKVREKAGEIRTGTRVLHYRREGYGLVLETSRGKVLCRYLINCCGLHSDRVARLCGVDPGLSIIPFRGEYYALIPEKRSLVRNLIYPVPNPAFPFLGVHFTRMINGDVKAGPNAVLAFKREGYKKRRVCASDARDILFYRGFWKLARKHWKMGMTESFCSLSRQAFVKALQKMLPELTVKDICASKSGVRAQALDPDGHLADDFRIVRAERMLHVLNAPSPAATASIIIGQTVAALAKRDFGLRVTSCGLRV